MKICHVTTAHPALDVRIFHKECVSLAKAGHQVTLLVAGEGKSFSLDGVEVIMVPMFHRGRLGRILRAPARMAAEIIKHSPDVVHFHDPEFLLAVSALQRKEIRIVYDVHEDLPRQILSKHWIPALLRKSLSRIIEWYENKKARSCNAIVAATPLIAARFIKINPLVAEIRNYPIPAEFDPIKPSSTDKPHVCYIGAISHIRGFNEMLAAVKPLEVVFDLAGHTESEEMLMQINGMAVDHKVIYHGQVGRQKVAEIMSKASAGLVLFHPEPNHTEALPTKMFEYMFAGVPVIASNFPLWQSIIEDNLCGLCVDPLDVHEISKAIQHLLDHPEEVRSMGQNGRTVAMAQYSWESEQKKLLRLYALLEDQSV